VLVVEDVLAGFSDRNGQRPLSTHTLMSSLTCIALVKGLVDGALALCAGERLAAGRLVVGGLVLLGRLAVDEVRDGGGDRSRGVGDGLHA
jgi:hypothetical protein